MTKSGPVGTLSIGLRPATNLFHAARFAREVGRAPTITISINWDRLGVPEDAASDTFRILRQRVRRRCRYLAASGATATALDDFGTHENPLGKRNTHWSVNVPAAEQPEFKRTVTKHLRKLAATSGLANAIHFQPIYANGLGGHVKYIVKGIRPDAAGYFHMQSVDQGFISGRGRTFVSRSLSFTARKTAGWKRKRRGPEPSESPTE